MSTKARRRAWIEVDGAALRENLRAVARRVGPDAALIPMVKADAYGLGVESTVRVLEPLEPWAYGVATPEEGAELRRLGVERPVLVFSPLPPGDEGWVVDEGLTPCVSDAGTLDRLAREARRAGATAAFHVEVDTGMGRAGFPADDVESWAPAVLERIADGALRWEGVFTHFHSADREAPDATVEQWERFRTVVDALPSGGDELVVHACNSAASLRLPEYAADAVRPGIYLYGGAPGRGIPRPDPVAAVRARVVLTRAVDAGSTVGYGATHRADGPERWATVGIGYGDGLPRLLSNRGSALVRGRRVPIVGRISMDVTVVDISGVDPVVPGDVVTFLGRDGDEEITLEEVAGHARTISYEVLTDLTPRLPRLWDAPDADEL